MKETQSHAHSKTIFIYQCIFMKKLELLFPAGNLEKLKYAIAYGADAVYA